MTYTADQLAHLRNEVGYGREVKALVENETFKKVLTDSIHGIQNAWLSCHDKEQREALWHQGSGLQAFANNLKSIVDTGKMAEHQLEFDKQIRGQNDES